MHVAASIAVAIALTVVVLPATAACLYLLVLTILSARTTPPSASSRQIFFDVIVPAHDEAAGIAKTIASLQGLDWPGAKYRIVVVADNCTDATAAISREAGATVLERRDLALRGKGYALAYAFASSRAAQMADAVVVVDADSVVSANLLESFAARIEAGAGALQAHYGVRNAMDSWRTRLMAIALGSIHKVRSRARERMQLSCGIRGNGWCVTHALLDKVPYRSYSLTEDVEFGVELGLAGHRVTYCDESDVNGEMVTSEHASRSQRQRWESGRIALIRAKVPALVAAAFARRSPVCLDLALDLLVLPLSYVVLNVLAIGVIGAFDPGGLRAVLLTIGLIDALAVGLYVCRGWLLSGVGLAGVWDLMRVPGFLVWKLVVVRFQSKPGAWIRTKRER
ncbi:MAG TPA: glycosyltransferase family 2 protein [Steroidobacteraceae bacterium]|nr:glycosyltransferase family 2 protein [Steroidobacteraceae bacterium]